MSESLEKSVGSIPEAVKLMLAAGASTTSLDRKASPRPALFTLFALFRQQRLTAPQGRTPAEDTSDPNIRASVLMEVSL